MGKYRIIKGKEFRPNGPKSLIVQEQLTDELAEFFIKKNPTILGTILELVEPNNKNEKVEKQNNTTNSKTKKLKNKIIQLIQKRKS